LGLFVLESGYCLKGSGQKWKTDGVQGHNKDGAAGAALVISGFYQEGQTSHSALYNRRLIGGSCWHDARLLGDAGLLQEQFADFELSGHDLHKSSKRRPQTN
jgi:hypothetical protein